MNLFDDLRTNAVYPGKLGDRRLVVAKYSVNPGAVLPTLARLGKSERVIYYRCDHEGRQIGTPQEECSFDEFQRWAFGLAPTRVLKREEVQA